MLAEPDDVVARLGRPLTATEEEQVDGLLEEASELVLAHIRAEDEPDPVPRAMVLVTSRMVARVLDQRAGATAALPAGAQQASASWGPFSQAVTFEQGRSSGGPWLSIGDKQMLARYRSSISVVEFSSAQTGRYRTEVDRW